MRIALTVDFSAWSAYSGGAQKSTHQLALALVDRGHDVVVFCTRGWSERVDAPAGLPYDVRWVPLLSPRAQPRSALRALTFLWMRPAVQRWLDESPGETAVVHSQGDEGAHFHRLRSRGRLAHVATLRHPLYPDARPPAARLARLAWWIRTPKWGLQRMTARRAQICAPASRNAADLIAAYYGVEQERLEVVPNGLDEVFLGDAVAREEMAQSVVFAGRFERSKGIETLLEAWSRLGAKAPRLTLFGQGQVDVVQETIAQRGLASRVSVGGWVAGAELARVLRGAGLVVVPSHHESFGNAVVEAMASGAPLVASAVGSVPELVEHARTGWLVPPQDPDALAEAVRRLMAEPALRRRLGAAARAHAASRFGWDRTAHQFEQLYDRLVQAEAGRTAGPGLVAGDRRPERWPA
ncbi:MAG: glycosyltransferase family 4 protein [Myxococcales bacterium FL481]|nr:MAG: glycosyltransferase family 4 protein [Myxococcales bacterium FL481]